MSSTTGEHRGQGQQDEAVQRAARLLPPGERLLGGHRVVAAEQMPAPRRSRRPVIFKGQRMAGDRLAGALFTTVRIISFQWNLVDAAYEAVEERERRKGQPFFGGWDSMAGHLARALFPRTKTGVVHVLLLTDRAVHLVHVQKARLGSRLGSHAEPGYAAEIRQIAWIRDRGDVKGGTHEVGFADGSWATVLFQGHGWRRFADSFPRKLRSSDPIP